MKKNTQSELWLTVYHWLKQCGSNPDKNFCREEITTHPDYPSLISTIDFLESGGMAYEAVRADSSHIHDFNYPLLAHIKESGQEYMHIVPDVAAWSEQKEITTHWSGVAVYPEKNAVWLNTENVIYQHTAAKNRIIAAVLLLIGLAVFAGAAYQQSGILINAFGLLSLAGLVVSLYALGAELGFQSQVVKQVCGAVSSGGCEQVLKSRFAKGIMGITPADVSVLYFAAQLMTYLLSSWYPVLLPFILWLSFPGIFVVTWSIYTQAYKLKQWCALCLGIAGVLALHVILSSVATGSSERLLPGTTSGIISGGLLFSFLLLLFTFILLPVKQLLKKNSSNQLKLSELKKWKLDADLFMNQWQQEQEVDASIWQNDLLLGKSFAPLTITVACNPYCGPCAKAHTQLHEMLHRFDGKLKVLIRFLCRPDDFNSKMTLAVSALLQNAAVSKSEIELNESITDWFGWMNYEKWIEKWHPDPLIDIKERIMWHHQWTEQSNIAYTPTFFLNGRKVPGRYGLEDMALLIPQLSERMIKEAETAV